mgnify:CR=1 FL=1
MLQGFIVNPVPKTRRKGKKMATRRKRRAPARRRTRRNPGHVAKRRKPSPMRRRRTSPTARRNPMRRRRRAVKKNPAGEFLMSSLIVAAAAALSAAFTKKVLVDGPEKKMHDYRVKNPGATEEDVQKQAGVPEGLRSTTGKALVNIGLGVLTGIMLDTFAKKGGAVQKAALPFGAGWIAVGTAIAVDSALTGQVETEDWYIAHKARELKELQEAKAKQPAPTQGLGALYDVAALSNMAHYDTKAGIDSVGQLYDGQLPHRY